MANAGTLSAIASELQSAIRAADPSNSAAFTGTRVASYVAGSENRLVVLPGVTSNAVVFAAAPLDTTTVSQLLLDTAGGIESNVQSYALGAGAAVLDTAQGFGTPGADGDPADGLALIGDLNAKTGIYALQDVDLFNILCLPRVAVLASNIATADAADAVINSAITYCEQRRAFFIMDTPPGIDEVQEIKDWLDTPARLRHKNAALYFPRVQIPDPLNGFKLRSVGGSGTIAGLYARTDSDRGVWKAPAGTDAVLRNVSKLEDFLTDQENGTLNPLAINCLRTFPIYGTVCWGARTLDGSDQKASEWKYIPVRRTALFIEESLYRGLKWVVFEPNDEPLWAQIRLNVGAFMNNLFRQGAFQGKTPREAYLVKCDRETTTQNDINLGIVNILVGFAPLKPAEFVFVKIQQLAGQITV
ncbi:MAG: phage tail sheath family protein [Leptolyngbyaceae cyanobacterium RU_5_1]|nr:phage tail sheath family protein [Leptolyngbyaceae cyanobacterium RU_5_1]